MTNNAKIISIYMTPYGTVIHHVQICLQFLKAWCSFYFSGEHVTHLCILAMSEWTINACSQWFVVLNLQPIYREKF